MNQKIKISLFIPLFVLSLVTSCVKNEVTGITMSKLTMDLNIAQTDSLIATIQVTGDINKFPVTWTSSDQNVVTVLKGKIQGVSTGKATITAKSGNLTAVCQVNVTNEIYPQVTVGHIIYRGDKFNSGLSNYFDVYLFGPTDTLALSFNLPLAIKDTLPVGTYKVLSVLNSEVDLKPYTSNPTFSTDGITAWGSFFIGKTINQVESGSIVIGTINKNYLIEFNLIDLYGNIIFGTFQGKLAYHDVTTSSPILPKKDLPIVKHASLLNKINIIKQ